ncbi:hypothetical protein ACYULU_06330 [Breznakiellaceae bacterium SP9]
MVAPVPQALSTPLVQYLLLVHAPTPEHSAELSVYTEFEPPASASRAAGRVSATRREGEAQDRLPTHFKLNTIPNME